MLEIVSGVTAPSGPRPPHAPGFTCSLDHAATGTGYIMRVSKVKMSRDTPRWPKGFRVG